MDQSAPTPTARVRGWLPSSPWRLLPGLNDLGRYSRRQQLRPPTLRRVFAASGYAAELGKDKIFHSARGAVAYRRLEQS